MKTRLSNTKIFWRRLLVGKINVGEMIEEDNEEIENKMGENFMLVKIQFNYVL